ncbi:AzlC family ABC transporter permease [Clostridium massiliamazoniense]|uniref:AzlC family ABC transporter permease n=1 Tax=Clostridium massiliamazoniense TaxID=1347366 RepID=UPI0006D808B2|nr:AzlC family ABC transporter permease [Clostridium massiliamazoniense]
MEGIESVKRANEFKEGLKKGIPIGLGYISVSITFGMLAVRGGLDIGTAVLISMTNLTSAGQFAGIDLILNNAIYIELALTTFIINIRYSLMSFAISQRLEKVSLLKRMILSFGITDETYALASLEMGKLSYKFMLGLITCPYLGWVIGTFIGAISTAFMPVKLQDSLGIALYGMFLAIIIPASRRDNAVLKAIVISSLMSIGFFYFPVLKNISGGFSIIICSIVGAMIMAKLKPVKEEK